jgi:hypothetical protein
MRKISACTGGPGVNSKFRRSFLGIECAHGDKFELYQEILLLEAENHLHKARVVQIYDDGTASCILGAQPSTKIRPLCNAIDSPDECIHNVHMTTNILVFV